MLFVLPGLQKRGEGTKVYLEENRREEKERGNDLLQHLWFSFLIKKE